MVVRTEESDKELAVQDTVRIDSLPWSSKAGSVAVCKNVGSYSREGFAGNDVSVAIDLESRGARHC
jgi:hypothetical protein